MAILFARPVSAIQNPTIGCSWVMSGVFLLLTEPLVILKRQSHSYLDIARIVRAVWVAKERRRHNTAIVLVLRMVERVPRIQNECHVRPQPTFRGGSPCLAS